MGGQIVTEFSLGADFDYYTTYAKFDIKRLRVVSFGGVKFSYFPQESNTAGATLLPSPCSRWMLWQANGLRTVANLSEWLLIVTILFCVCTVRQMNNLGSTRRPPTTTVAYKLPASGNLAVS